MKHFFFSKMASKVQAAPKSNRFKVFRMSLGTNLGKLQIITYLIEFFTNNCLIIFYGNLIYLFYTLIIKFSIELFLGTETQKYPFATMRLFLMAAGQMRRGRETQRSSPFKFCFEGFAVSTWRCKRKEDIDIDNMHQT